MPYIYIYIYILDISSLPKLEEFKTESLYIPQHLIPIVLGIPKIFENSSEGELYKTIFKEVFERHPIKITGLKSDLTVEFSTLDYEVRPYRVIRAESTPSFTFAEKYGRPIQRLLNHWLSTLSEYLQSKSKYLQSNPDAANEFILDEMSMTMLFIEPDPTFRFVQRAYLCRDMLPTTSGPEESKRDKSSAMDKLEYDIEFKCTTKVDKDVIILANKNLEQLEKNSSLNINNFANNFAKRLHEGTQALIDMMQDKK